MMTEEGIVDFIGIGFPKCGTTWIQNVIDQHPQFYKPKFKEFWFFFSKELHEFTIMPDTYKESNSWYLSHFKGKKSSQITGEFTPTYIYDYDGLVKIKTMFPTVKIIISIRNIIEMMYSQYHYMRSSVVDTIDRNLFEIYDHNDQKYQSFRNLGKLCYYLEQAMRVFKGHEILIIDFNDIRHNPGKTVKQLYRFLEIDEDFKPDIQPQNYAREAIFPRLNQLIHFIYSILKKFNIGWLAYKFPTLYSIFLKINTKKKKKNKILKEEYNLMFNYYHDDILKLEKMWTSLFQFNEIKDKKVVNQ